VTVGHSTTHEVLTAYSRADCCVTAAELQQVSEGYEAFELPCFVCAAARFGMLTVKKPFISAPVATSGSANEHVKRPHDRSCV
jgi:hypothetical protein